MPRVAAILVATSLPVCAVPGECQDGTLRVRLTPQVGCVSPQQSSSESSLILTASLR